MVEEEEVETEIEVKVEIVAVVEIAEMKMGIIVHIVVVKGGQLLNMDGVPFSKTKESGIEGLKEMAKEIKKVDQTLES